MYGQTDGLQTEDGGMEGWIRDRWRTEGWTDGLKLDRWMDG